LTAPLDENALATDANVLTAPLDENAPSTDTGVSTAPLDENALTTDASALTAPLDAAMPSVETSADAPSELSTIESSSELSGQRNDLPLESSPEFEPTPEPQLDDKSVTTPDDYRDPMGVLATGMLGMAHEGDVGSASTGVHTQPAAGMVDQSNPSSQAGSTLNVPEVEIDGNTYRFVPDEPMSPTPDPSTYEYLKGSPHDDFELYSADKQGREQAELSRAASMADSLPDALATTAAAIKESQSGESKSDSQVREWFESKYGTTPYTEEAYPEIQPDEEPSIVTDAEVGSTQAIQTTEQLAEESAPRGVDEPSSADVAPQPQAIPEDNTNVLENNLEEPTADIEKLKSDAIAAAVERLNEPSDPYTKSVRTSVYSDACGTLGEELCIRANGFNGLDETLTNNSPVFDASSESELASVKAHIVGNEEIAIGNYAHDLRAAMGLVDEETFDKAVNATWEAHTDPEKWGYLQSHLPEAVCNAATVEELRAAMQDASTLRIPADHVEKVQEYLDRVVAKNPELYGIDPDSGEQEFQAKLDALKARVMPIAENVTAHDMRVAARDVFQTKLHLK
jgi:hypothetical protein